MTRLCSDSLCPYPGRSAQRAVGVAKGAGLRAISKGMELPPDPKARSTARGLATTNVTEQKSAEAIVAEPRRKHGAVKGRTSPYKEEPWDTRTQ
jgi:hypothetical protein